MVNKGESVRSEGKPSPAEFRVGMGSLVVGALSAVLELALSEPKLGLVTILSSAVFLGNLLLSERRIRRYENKIENYPYSAEDEKKGGPYFYIEDGEQPSQVNLTNEGQGDYDSIYELQISVIKE